MRSTDNHRPAIPFHLIDGLTEGGDRHGRFESLVGLVRRQDHLPIGHRRDKATIGPRHNRGRGIRTPVRIASRLVGPAAAASDLAGVRFELK